MGLEFIADYRPIASSITGEYRLHMLHTVYIAIGTMMRPHVQDRLPEAPAAVPWPVLPPAGGACAHAHAVGGKVLTGLAD